MKIGKKLPFTLKNKHRNTNLKFDFFKVRFLTPEKVRFLFLKKTPPKKFVSSCIGFDSASKTIDAQMFFWSVFLKTHKKSYWLSTTLFWPFLAVKNTDQNNIFKSIALKAKTKEKSVLHKRMRCSFRSFLFFIKEHSVLCVLFGFISHTKIANLYKKRT